MVVQAYILIQTEVGKAANVAAHIGQIKGVTLAEDVTGPYDVIVRAEARTVDELVNVTASIDWSGSSVTTLWKRRCNVKSESRAGSELGKLSSSKGTIRIGSISIRMYRGSVGCSLRWQGGSRLSPG